MAIVDVKGDGPKLEELRREKVELQLCEILLVLMEWDGDCWRLLQKS